MDDNLKRDMLVEGATQAKITLETYTNPGITSRSQGGDAMRIHDFINADIPLMIAAANNKLGTPDFPVFDMKDERMNTRLDLDPMSLRQRLDQDFEAATHALQWIGPHLPPAAAHFFKRGEEGGFEQLRDQLVEQREAVAQRENTIEVAHERYGKAIPAGDVEKGVVDYVEDLASKRDQFVNLKDGERARIDVMVFEYSESSMNMWTNRYAVSTADGQTRTVSDNDIDSGQPAYGVIIERNDKTYFVPMSGQLDGTPEGDAREVIGIDQGLRKHQDREIIEADGAIDYQNGEEVMRSVTGRDVQGDQQAKSGAFTYRNANKQYDDRGPIILTDVSWTTSVDLKERVSAERMVDIQDFKTSNMIPRSIVTNDVGEKESLKADPNKMAMQLAAAQAQGIAI